MFKIFSEFLQAPPNDDLDKFPASVAIRPVGPEVAKKSGKENQVDENPLRRPESAVEQQKQHKVQIPLIGNPELMQLNLELQFYRNSSLF